MAKLAVSFPQADETDETKALRGQTYREELQPYLTDHEWTHAVSEALRGGQWFPTIFELADHAKRAPAPPPPKNSGFLTGSFGCEICGGTGWEIVERSGYPVSQPCPNLCKPNRVTPSGNGAEISRVEARKEFGGIEAKLKAICREKGFRYPGIEEDAR